MAEEAATGIARGRADLTLTVVSRTGHRSRKSRPDTSFQAA
jgi:hypothetical protein